MNKAIENRTKENVSVISKVFTGIGIAACIILIPIVIINIVLIVNSFSSKGLPQIGGVLPQVVMTGSMSPEIEAGDLIISKQTDPEEIQIGDVITFYDPSGNGEMIETHRVTDIVVHEHGTKTWLTKGDNNNVQDSEPVPFENLIARYDGLRIEGAGDVILFMQTTRGIILCVLIPLLIFIAYDLIRRKLYDKKNQLDTAALIEELEKLRAANINTVQP